MINNYGPQINSIIEFISNQPEVLSEEESRDFENQLNERVSSLFTEMQSDRRLTPEFQKKIKSQAQRFMHISSEQDKSKMIKALQSVRLAMDDIFRQSFFSSNVSSTSVSSPSKASVLSTAPTGLDVLPAELHHMIRAYDKEYDIQVSLLRKLFSKREVPVVANPVDQIEVFQAFIREHPGLAAARLHHYINKRMKEAQQDGVLGDKREKIEFLTRFALHSGLSLTKGLVVQLLRVPVSAEFIRELLQNYPISNRDSLVSLFEFIQSFFSLQVKLKDEKRRAEFLYSPTEFVEIFNLLFDKAKGVLLTSEDQNWFDRGRSALNRLAKERAHSDFRSDYLSCYTKLNEYPNVRPIRGQGNS